MADILITAHGSPSEPDLQEAALARLARAVQALRPNDRVRAATLAKPGALAAAIAGLDRPLIYPFFMAEGWFTRHELPRRLAGIGVPPARQIAPFGTDPALPGLIESVLLEAGTPGPVLLVAHGSKIARQSRDSVYDMAEALRARDRLPPITVALIEEPPFLPDVARDLRSGLCLPFFALRAGHVTGDIPDALNEAGYTGQILPEIGAHPQVPALIAASLERAL